VSVGNDNGRGLTSPDLGAARRIAARARGRYFFKCELM